MRLRTAVIPLGTEAPEKNEKRVKQYAMMQKIQKFGGAMFTPVLLFAFAGIVVGVGTLFTTP